MSNIIRQIVNSPIKPNPDKSSIPLSIGDPTVFGNFRVHPVVTEAITEAMTSGKFNGYGHAQGLAIARDALADKYSKYGLKVFAEDVTLTCGASQALEMAFSCAADEGENVLLPCPGFSLYRTHCDYFGIEPRYYRLMPERDWEADLAQMETLVDSKTRAILINNPSNPCGSVYKREHLVDLLKFAQRHNLIVIADEIYDYMTFPPYEFFPMSSVGVPVAMLTVGGLAKHFCVPGWRIGWLVVMDLTGIVGGAMAEIREGIAKMATIIVGPTTLIQAAIPRILREVPQSYHDGMNAELSLHAKTLAEGLKDAVGLTVVMPRGAMYAMVCIDPSQYADLADDVAFSRKLVEEESVQVIPGIAFGLANSMRIVIAPPVDVLKEACLRICSFCNCHRKK